MKQISLALLGVLSLGGLTLAGCGSGGSAAIVSPAPTGRSVTGQALVPAGTATRAADEPVAGATVALTDITSGLPGTPVKTATTDAEGKYRFDELTPGHTYMLVVTKTTTTGTLSLGVMATVPTNATAATEAKADVATTVALNKVVATLMEDNSVSINDLKALFEESTRVFKEQRESNIAPVVDLTRDCTKPESHKEVGEQVAEKALKSGVYLSDIPDAVRNGDGPRAKGRSEASGDYGHVNFWLDANSRKVELALFVLDKQYDFFDADLVRAEVSAKGEFEATSEDGLYVVTGKIVGREAQGRWRAKDNSTGGRWSAKTRTAEAAGMTATYSGTFRATSGTVREGKWIYFIHPTGEALFLGRDMGDANTSHLLKTVVFAGHVDAAGVFDGSMQLPVQEGEMKGTFPNGMTTISGTFQNGSREFSLEGHLGGEVADGVVTGQWSISGSENGKAFQHSGTLAGIHHN